MRRKVRKVVEVSSAQTATGRLEESRAVGPKQEIENLAKARLIQCVDLLKTFRDVNQALNVIRLIQNSWNPEKEQVSVVINDHFALHPDPRTQTLLPAVCWPDEMSGNQPLYPAMKSQRHGLKIARIKGTKSRLTAIAFETVENPACMVFAEAHYHEAV